VFARRSDLAQRFRSSRVSLDVSFDGTQQKDDDDNVPSSQQPQQHSSYYHNLTLQPGQAVLHLG